MTSNTPIAFLSKKLHSDGLLGNRTLLDVMHPSADVLTYKMRARQPVQRRCSVLTGSVNRGLPTPVSSSETGTQTASSVQFSSVQFSFR